jgi:glutaredoxin 2
MRRVKSAPANLSAMAHNKKNKEKPNTVLLATDKTNALSNDSLQALGEDETMGDFISQVSSEIEINDPTEQLLLFMIFRSFTKIGTIDWNVIIINYTKRLVLSYITHHLMIYALLCYHTGHIELPPKLGV